MPTQQQLDNVRNNALHITDFINHLHDYFQDVVNEVFPMINQETDYDAGQKWVSFVYSLTMSAFADVELKGSDTFSAFMSTILSSYDNDTPSNEGLNTVISDVWMRLSKTFLQANDDLALIAENPEKYWNEFYWSETLNKRFGVSQLGDILFPAKDDVVNNGPLVFSKGTDLLIPAFKYALTKYTLGKKWSILHDPTHLFWPNANDSDMIDFGKKITNTNQEIIFLWKKDQSGSCASCPTDGLSSYEPRLGIGDWYSNYDFYHGASPTKDMLHWLIKDDGFGTILNPDAIAMRHEIFYEWGLEGNLTEHPNYLINEKEQHQPSQEDKECAIEWFKLFREKGRKNIEDQIIEKAYSDPEFYRELMKNSKETLEKELGIKLPENVSIDILQEDVGSYKLVLPAIGHKNRSFNK